MSADWIVPDWPAPAPVKALMTTRRGGVSAAPFDSFNPASHVGDAPEAVAENRRRLRALLPAEPLWLNQVHGIAVARFAAASSVAPEADACVAMQAGQICVVLTADCLPVLFCDRAGTVVAAAHAGWRGLAGGVLEATVAAMQVPAGQVLAWLGAAIGPQAFEVGPEVREAFVSQHPEVARAFIPHPSTSTPHRLMADLYALARIRLAAIGVTSVYGGGLCTFSDAQRFYSYRRDRQTGRMASLIWLGGT
jgi:YfiH family protein